MVFSILFSLYSAVLILRFILPQTKYPIASLNMIQFAEEDYNLDILFIFE